MSSAVSKGSTSWHDLGSLERLERDGHLLGRVGGREIGVVRTPDGPRAVRNRCPHHGGPLCLGTVRERLTGTPGRYELEGRRVLSCPWHGWEFDITTGRSWFDPARTRVRAYDATVEPADADLVDAGYEPGPYDAERYDVEVHRQFVVVHV